MSTPETCNLDALIEALMIFRKYGNPEWPTHCEHDVLYVNSVVPSKMSADDLKRLGELSFYHPALDALDALEGNEENSEEDYDEEDYESDSWYSFGFGSN
jgi:hypothetical protein